MNTNKEIRLYINILGIIFVSIFIGCDKKLQLFPLSEPSAGSFYSSSKEVAQALDAIYFELGDFYGGQSIPSYFGELSSDNAYIRLSTGANNFNEQIDQFFITPDNGIINDLWDRAYHSIYVCNNALKYIESNEFDMDEEKMNILKGQALCLRSLFYFNMVRAWGAIPYVSQVVTADDALLINRIDPEVIYDSIIVDLKFASNVLPSFYSGKDIGRVTKYGANAILAKVYLTLNRKQEARDELEKVINSGIYSLDANNDGVINIDDYAFLFKPGTKNCKSSVLEVQYLAGPNAMNSTHQRIFSPFLRNFHVPDVTQLLEGGGVNTPTQDLAAEFELTDKRKELSFDEGYFISGTSTFIDYPYTLKFYDPQILNPGQNVEIIRYADILLMYSEVTGDPQYLNMVRERAGLANFGTTDYPIEKYPTLTAAIEHERRVELCFEFHRFYDLIRTGRAIEVMNSNGFSIDQHNLVFPIPTHIIDVNPLIKQNPGY